MKNIQEVLRQIPAVDSVLQRAGFGELIGGFGREPTRRGVQKVLAETREQIRSGQLAGEQLEQTLVDEQLVRAVRALLEEAHQISVGRVINATGVILHTGLGRARLPTAAMEALAGLDGYCTLQIDLQSGRRGKRDSKVEELLVELTGAQAATVVNNNAAATLLVLSEIGKGREIIVSRGQLVEIGGSFRIPEVMEESGAKLVEVGTTNRTHLADYERAINENTAALLHVHTSNYRIVGFSSTVPIEELAELGHSHGLTVIDDIGSGNLVDMRRLELPEEPTAQRSIEAGADLVTFSADKLIGGPQGGIILGTKVMIDRIRKNPLARALRVGKLTLAALEATLQLFRDEGLLLSRHPTWRMLSCSEEELHKQAKSLARRLSKLAADLDVK
ncbi:MAG: L-seryl-tRNA(Sec) selenium transferase, partial [Phycisphaerae bacterium]|nr:L-seryl-tRNA(Sec) selenium transferase [Phycisphaerae bacterium]